MFVCLVLLLPAITGISAAGQSSSSTLCAPTAHAVVLYAPESNLERSEIETLRTAKVSVDVAMYSFTDRELAAELVRLARSGVRVRVYRDSRESMQAVVFASCSAKVRAFVNVFLQELHTNS
jgi:phosphatidylserine/phosphatidylglycerophosphate/cardiolipin synthase-like enzyme